MAASSTHLEGNVRAKRAEAPCGCQCAPSRLARRGFSRDAAPRLSSRVVTVVARRHTCAVNHAIAPVVTCARIKELAIARCALTQCSPRSSSRTSLSGIHILQGWSTRSRRSSTFCSRVSSKPERGKFCHFLRRPPRSWLRMGREDHRARPSNVITQSGCDCGVDAALYRCNPKNILTAGPPRCTPRVTCPSRHGLLMRTMPRGLSLHPKFTTGSVRNALGHRSWILRFPTANSNEHHAARRPTLPSSCTGGLDH